MAGSGGIIGDKYNYETWIKQYSRAICIANSIISELRGLRDRLILCFQLQLDAIDIEQAAKVAVCLIKHLNYLVNLSFLVDDCRDLHRPRQTSQLIHLLKGVSD